MAEVAYPRLHKAVRWACKLHKNQDRDGKSPLPYISHVLEVVSNLRHVGGVTDEEMLCASALHDVIEQSGVSVKRIEDKFGPRVAGLVVEMTRHEPSPDETAGMSEFEIWELRSRLLLDEIKSMSPDAQKIKLADRLSNTRFALVTKIAGKRERHLGQTEEILKIIPRRVNPALWDSIRAELNGASARSKPAAKKKRG